MQAGTVIQGKDKRNLYLAKEGDIPVGSPAWVGMSEHDRCVFICVCDVGKFTRGIVATFESTVLQVWAGALTSFRRSNLH